jgi:hypothetical protein
MSTWRAKAAYWQDSQVLREIARQAGGWFRLGAVFLVAICQFPQAPAQTVANFTAGNSNTSLDGFKGMGNASLSWNTGWVFTNDANITHSGTVTTGNSLLNGGGNYLATTLVLNNTNSSSTMLARTYNTGFNGINTSQVMEYTFTYSPISVSSTYRIFDNVGSVGVGTGGNNTWALGESGGYWTAMNVTNAVNTTMAFVANDVYSFTILSNPTAQNWSVTINDLTQNTTWNSATAGVTLDYRYNNTTLMDGLVDGTNLEFGILNATTAGTYGFDLANLTIQTVPEPPIWGLGALGLIGLFFYVYLRRYRAKRVA